MATARMKSVAVWIAPMAMLAGLVVWTAADVLRIGDVGWRPVVLGLLVLGALALASAVLFGWDWAQPSGFVFLGLAYFGSHAVFLGMEVIPALAYLVLLALFSPVRSLARRFSPAYARDLTPELMRRTDVALARAALRIGVTAALALLVPILAANLALTGFVPLRTIPSAVILAGGLIAVVLTLALLPVLERRKA